MKKTLVTVDNLKEFICTDNNKLYHTSGLIITAGAKDLCVKMGVEIVYGQVPCTSSCACHAQSSTNYQGSIACTQSSGANQVSGHTQSQCTKNASTSFCKSEDTGFKSFLLDASNPKAPQCRAGVTNDPLDQLLVKLSLVIREITGITDLVQLRQMSMEAAKIIHKNL